MSLKLFKERRVLKKQHELRLTDTPFLLYRQLKVNGAKKRRTMAFQEQISNYKEKESRFQDITKPQLITPDRAEQLRTQLPSRTRDMAAFWNSIKSDDPDRVKRVTITIENGVERLRAKSLLDWFAHFSVKYANLYYKSLQELVEGHREVIQKHDTILPDGKTVKEKLDAFEENLGKTLSLKNRRS